MLLQFADEAEAVIRDAAQQAERLGHDWIGTEHLLLAVTDAAMRGTAALTPEELANAGVSTATIRELTRPSMDQPGDVERRWTPGAIRAIAWGPQIAARAGRDSAMPGDLLVAIAITQSSDSPMFKSIRKHAACLTRTSPGRRSTSVPVPVVRLTNGALETLDIASQIASQTGQSSVGTDQILLALLAEREGAAAAVLTELGVDWAAALRMLSGRGRVGTSDTDSLPWPWHLSELVRAEVMLKELPALLEPLEQRLKEREVDFRVEVADGRSWIAAPAGIDLDEEIASVRAALSPGDQA